MNVDWEENGVVHAAMWRSENGTPAPKRIVIADDATTADAAYRLACEGTALLWRGDFQNARQLLQAMGRRADQKKKKSDNTKSITETFHLHRQAQLQRARTLGMLLIPVDAGHRIPLRRAPDVMQACREAYAHDDGAYVVSLRELQGLIGAHEWRKNGVRIPALSAEIQPHYGVFSPIRGEYLDLIAAAPLPSTERAFDIGTGTAVIAALLAKRGVKQVIATELNSRALACARDNVARLGLEKTVHIQEADLFPQGEAPLIVCNPPWVPGSANSLLDQAIYDPENRMLLGFLNGLASHLSPDGEGWLILSDLAEHLGLRSREFLLQAIHTAGLQVVERRDIRPRHGKASDANDPLHAARAAEVTSLWRLARA
ncbi:MAG TPA: class I SAM-dependent methyltransferase [Rhodocyclaceae bacterium]|nr:class I SAM-dependent methyltransferase [Rhodocyclaceae bacterium]